MTKILFLLLSFPALTQSITITEIMYQPPISASDSIEFIELYNRSDSTIDLSGWTISNAVDITFPAGTTLPPDNFLYATNDSVSFFIQFNILTSQWVGNLNDSGELILLKDSSGNTIDSVHYTNINPWPNGTGLGEPNAGGASISICNANTNNNLSTSWEISSNPSGRIIGGKELFVSISSFDTILNTMPEISICKGDSAFIFFQKYVLDSGIYYDTISFPGNCTHIFAQHVSINESTVDTLSPLTICAGDSVQIFGEYKFNPGYYINYDTNKKGCDSIIYQQLIVLNTPHYQISDTICLGDSIQIGSKWYFSATNVSDTILGGANNGCDSINDYTIILNTVNPSLNIGDSILSCIYDDVILSVSSSYSNYQWNTGSTNNSILLSGNDQGLGSATYTISVIDGSNGCSDSDSIEVNFIPCTNIEDYNKTVFSINTYPNPTSDLIMIDVIGINDQAVEIELFNLTGKKVASHNSSLSQIISVGHLEKGIYFIRVNSMGLSITKKIILK